MHGVTRRRLGREAGAIRHGMRRCSATLSLFGLLAVVVQAAAFDTSCGTLAAGSPDSALQFPAVVAVSASGRATGIEQTWQDGKAQRRLGSGDFALSGRGVVVGQFVVTAAHVVSPEKVVLKLDEYTTIVSPVVAVQKTAVAVGTSTGAGGIPATIVHLNHEADLAILRPENSTWLHPFPYAATATWWREHPGEANSLLGAEDCVITLVPERDAYHLPLLGAEARIGKVIAPYAVSSSSAVVADLNSQTVTISTPVSPGDSGSPVVVFDMGRPRLVGIVSATRQPVEAKSYISRIDSLLPILEALQYALASGVQIAHAQ
jgi:Trypsin-like peptidase domain